MTFTYASIVPDPAPLSYTKVGEDRGAAEEQNIKAFLQLNKLERLAYVKALVKQVRENKEAHNVFLMDVVTCLQDLGIIRHVERNFPNDKHGWTKRRYFTHGLGTHTVEDQHFVRADDWAFRFLHKLGVLD